jgi:hypothetical protein
VIPSAISHQESLLLHLQNCTTIYLSFRSSPRPISTSQLKALLPLHTWPIYLIIYEGSYQVNPVGDLFLRSASHLDAFSAYPSALGYPAVHLAVQLVCQRCVHPGPLVLGTAPLKSPAPATDRDRTVSRRSEPSSRTALMGEQPNPWNLLSSRMRRADIEVPNLPVDVDSWGR